MPLPQDREQWSWSNIHWTFIPFLPLLFMAYLARRRDTFAIRLLLLPMAICLPVHFAYGCAPPSISGTVMAEVSCGLQVLFPSTMASVIQLGSRFVIRIHITWHLTHSWPFTSSSGMCTAASESPGLRPDASRPAQSR